MIPGKTVQDNIPLTLQLKFWVCFALIYSVVKFRLEVVNISLNIKWRSFNDILRSY